MARVHSESGRYAMHQCTSWTAGNLLRLSRFVLGAEILFTIMKFVAAFVGEIKTLLPHFKRHLRRSLALVILVSLCVVAALQNFAD